MSYLRVCYFYPPGPSYGGSQAVSSVDAELLRAIRIQGFNMGNFEGENLKEQVDSLGSSLTGEVPIDDAIRECEEFCSKSHKRSRSD